MRGGPVAANPILRVLASKVGAALPVRTLERIIEARRLVLGGAPPADEAALVAFIDYTAGAAMTAAAMLLEPDWTDKTQLLHTARAWGWAQVARGGTPHPGEWADASPREISGHIAHRITGALKLARGELQGFPTSAFPAVAHAALAKRYSQGAALSELEKRIRVTLAVLLGRV